MTRTPKEINQEISDLTKLIEHKVSAIREAASDEICKLHRELRQIELNDSHMMERIDALLILIPKHTHSTCSDSDPINVSKCDRCALLDMKEDSSWNSDYDFEVNLIKKDRFK